MSGGDMKQWSRALYPFVFVLVLAATLVIATFTGGQMNAQTSGQTAAARVAGSVTPRAFFDTYCVTCHDQEQLTAGLALDKVDLS
jgi:cytochrome c5